MSRRWVDNACYYREGGQAGIETKRGCPGRCIYCADPLAKGRDIRTRPPGAVADELERLLAQGIDHIHLCDSEFNMPEEHARAVCGEIIRRHLGDRVHWYAYCSPVPFSASLARMFRRAGCAGINFGVDNGDPHMLARLERPFIPGDILRAVRACAAERIAVMCDLLLGSPGETEESITRTIDLMKRAGPDRVGVALGVRVYPGTALAEMIARENRGEGLRGDDGTSAPLFFIEPAVVPRAPDLIARLTDGDERFLFNDPSRPEANYNYNANELLVDAVKRGYRGAYWDILRRVAHDLPNTKSHSPHSRRRTETACAKMDPDVRPQRKRGSENSEG